MSNPETLKSISKALPPQVKLAMKALENKHVQSALKLARKVNLMIWLFTCVVPFLCLITIAGSFILNNGFTSDLLTAFLEDYGSSSAQQGGPNSPGEITQTLNANDVDGVSSLDSALRNYFEQSVCNRIPTEKRPEECE